MDSPLRRWLTKRWAPFALVLLGALILWIGGFGFGDTTAIILMVVLICLLAAGGSSRPTRRPDNWRRH